jgi:hypothetical protein
MTLVSGSVTVIPLYGVWPVSATVIVKPTVEPGVVVLADAVFQADSEAEFA